LVQGAADAATLGLVFDDYEAEEAAACGEASAHRIGLSEHAVEDEGHVVVFGELEDSQHAADGLSSVISVGNSPGG